MKILHVIDNLKLGGTQNLAYRTWELLAQNGHEVTVCVLTSSKFEAEWKHLPRVHRLNVHGDYRRPFAVSGWSKRVANIVSDTRPEIIHSWLWLSDVVAAGAAARTATPHLSHIVDRRNWQLGNRFRDRYRRWVTKRLFQRAETKFLSVSKAAGDFAIETLGIPESNVRVAYNSIVCERFEAIPSCEAWNDNNVPLRLGIASRIEPEKGHEFLLRAVALLKNQGVSCSLKVTGDGPGRPLLEQLSRQLEVEDRVDFVGWVKSVESFLENIDAFMVPSIDSEGLPTTILEAMSAGRMVICTDIGGAVEAVSDGHTGLVVAPRDPQALARAVMSVHNDRNRAAQMCERARLRVREQFEMSRMMSVVQEAYRSVAILARK